MPIGPGKYILLPIPDGAPQLDESRTDPGPPPGLQRSMGDRKQTSGLLLGQEDYLKVINNSHEGLFHTLERDRVH
jgi:hypothetical protein